MASGSHDVEENELTMTKQIRPKVICPGCKHVFRKMEVFQGHWQRKQVDTGNPHYNTPRAEYIRAVKQFST